MLAIYLIILIFVGRSDKSSAYQKPLCGSRFRHEKDIFNGEMNLHATETPTHTNMSTLPSTMTEYSDNLLEKIALSLLSGALGILSVDKQAGLKKVGPSYKAFVDTSFEFMRNRKSHEIRDVIVGLLSAIIPDFVKKAFKKAYLKRSTWIAEQSVIWFKFNFLRWLVGPAEAVKGTSTELYIPECRYLAESGCKSACINLCKIPCQTFFSEVLNFPLWMEPKYEEKGCVFHFGVAPPALEDDPALMTSCYTDCKYKIKSKSTIDSSLNYDYDYDSVEAYMVTNDGINRCL
jgi:hypothetical protein